MSDRTKHYSVSRAQWTHFGFHAVHTSRTKQANQNSDVEAGTNETDPEYLRQLEMAEEV